jgi:hypothetical protein
MSNQPDPERDEGPVDTPETGMPINARMGALIMGAIVLVCVAITLIVVLAGGLHAVVWQ